MKAKVKIPKGWRRLRWGAIIKNGDRYIFFYTDHGDKWVECRRINEGEREYVNLNFIYIRRLQRKPTP